MILAALSQDAITALYIVAFSLFIYGLMGLTGPRTAVRGNRIAAVGMAIAIFATLLIPGMGNWGLIILGVAIGTAIGIPAARTVKMTQMPQMVALFNGVGGGAVALIAWAEFNETGGYDGLELTFVIPSLFAAIVGSAAQPLVDRNSAQAIRKIAPPPTPLNSATICGIAVIFTRRAPTNPNTPPTTIPIPTIQ